MTNVVTLVNFFWTNDDGEVASFMVRWQRGLSIPRKGEFVALPAVGLLEVESVEYDINPSRHSVDRLDCIVSVINIRVRAAGGDQ